MPYYTSNLIRKIIEEPAKFSDELVIVSGYGSPTFLNDIRQRIPDHKIVFILGMTPLGISRDNFEGFKEVNNNENVDVFFQVKHPPTHMKLYQWYKKAKPNYSFLGSANFSYAGFEEQNEILATSDRDFDKIISEIKLLCLKCTDAKIPELIKIYDEDEYKKIENIREVLGEYGNEELPPNRGSETFPPKKYIRKTRAYFPHRANIQLILENDSSWHSKGINVWTREGKDMNDSYIDLIKNYRTLDKFFPKHKAVELETNDGLNLIVERRGGYGRELVILNEETNFYDYFSRRLGLDTLRPISYADLKTYGRTDVEITKIGNNRFKLSF